jgi:hypothetical protein
MVRGDTEVTVREYLYVTKSKKNKNKNKHIRKETCNTET